MECPALDLFDLTVPVQLYCSFTESFPDVSLRHEFNRLPDGHEQIMIALPA